MQQTAVSQSGPCTGNWKTKMVKKIATAKAALKNTPLGDLTQLMVEPTAPAAPVTIALRGGPAVSQVALTGAVYRTTAPHNQQWWLALSAKLKDTTLPVAGLLLNETNKDGVPAHFIGYALRRGYLKSVA